MKVVKPRYDPVRIFWRRVRLAVLIVAVILALSAVIDIYRKERTSAQLRSEADMRLAELAKEEEQLNTKIATLSSERGMEEAVRSQYQMGHTGERMVTIVDHQAPAPTEATSTLRTLLHKVLPWW